MQTGAQGAAGEDMVLRKEDPRLSGRMVGDMKVDMDMIVMGGEHSGGWFGFEGDSGGGSGGRGGGDVGGGM